jgi:predicted peptidase
MKAIIKVFVTVIAILLICQPCFAKEEPTVIDKPEYIVYVPSGIEYSQRYPLVIALHPAASASSMINVWKETAEKHKWIILASKEFRNGINTLPIYARIFNILDELTSDLPIDRAKIIATGLSGGGMGSHELSFLYPHLISAIIVNTGMMNEYYLNQKNKYPSGKIAVFLASPTDVRYGEMQRDERFLQGLGWQTKWIEFEGGHIFAPASVYEEAVEWLEERLR